YPLPSGQGHDGAVQTIALVMECGLGGRIAFLGPVVDQPRLVGRAERYFPPQLGGQPDALTAANGDQPTVQLVRVGELVDVFHAAQPGELDGVARVFGGQPTPAGEPPQQRLPFAGAGAAPPILSPPASRPAVLPGPRPRGLWRLSPISLWSPFGSAELCEIAGSSAGTAAVERTRVRQARESRLSSLPHSSTMGFGC